MAISPVFPLASPPLVPSELSLDFHEGMAYLGIVLFAMEGIRHRWWPEQFSMQFLEANVRTCVHHKNTHGIHFLSLDTSSRLAVSGTLAAWSLRYHHAQMKMVEARRRRSSSIGAVDQMPFYATATRWRRYWVHLKRRHWNISCWNVTSCLPGTGVGSAKVRSVIVPTWRSRPSCRNFKINCEPLWSCTSTAGIPRFSTSWREWIPRFFPCR